jgi:hypothetical protein
MAEDDVNKRRLRVLRLTYDGSGAGSMEAFELALKSAFPTGTKYVGWQVTAPSGESSVSYDIVLSLMTRLRVSDVKRHMSVLDDGGKIREVFLPVPYEKTSEFLARQVKPPGSSFFGYASLLVGIDEGTVVDGTGNTAERLGQSGAESESDDSVQHLSEGGNVGANTVEVESRNDREAVLVRDRKMLEGMLTSQEEKVKLLEMKLFAMAVVVLLHHLWMEFVPDLVWASWGA